MKLVCTTENLKKGILVAEKIIGKNLTLPILLNILLEAEKGGLKISATNLEIGLITKVRAKIEKEGKIAVPGRIIGGILSQLGDGSQITLEEKNSTLRMIYNGNSAAIKGMDAKDFPIIPKPESKFLFEISAAELQKKAGNIIASAAVSDTRQELTGVQIEFGETKITLAATDSFRLYRVIKLGKNIYHKLELQAAAKDFKIILLGWIFNMGHGPFLLVFEIEAILAPNGEILQEKSPAGKSRANRRLEIDADFFETASDLKNFYFL